MEAGFVHRARTVVHLRCWERFDHIEGRRRSLVRFDRQIEMVAAAKVQRSGRQDNQGGKVHVGIAVELDWYRVLERKGLAEVPSTIVGAEVEG